MLLFLRRLAEKIGDFLDMVDSPNEKLDRTYPWDSEFETDYNKVLYRSDWFKFMNPDYVSDAKNMECLFLDNVVKVKIIVPTGYNILSLFAEEKDLSKSKEYGFPYIIVSEDKRDCRIVVFESVECLMAFLNSVAPDMTHYMGVLDGMKDHIRIIRQYYNSRYGYFTALNMYDQVYTGEVVKVNHSSFKTPENGNYITKLLTEGSMYRNLNDKVKQSDFTYLRPAMLKDIVLNDSGNFIDHWDIGGK